MYKPAELDLSRQPKPPHTEKLFKVKVEEGWDEKQNTNMDAIKPNEVWLRGDEGGCARVQGEG